MHVSFVFWKTGKELRHFREKENKMKKKMYKCCRLNLMSTANKSSHQHGTTETEHLRTSYTSTERWGTLSILCLTQWTISDEQIPRQSSSCQVLVYSECDNRMWRRGENPTAYGHFTCSPLYQGSAINPLLYVILYTPVTSKVVFPILHKVNRE